MLEGQKKRDTVNGAPVNFTYEVSEEHGRLNVEFLDDTEDIDIDDYDVVLVKGAEQGRDVEIIVSTPKQLLVKQWDANGLPPDFLKKHPISQGQPPHLQIPPNANGEPNVHVIVSSTSGTGEAEAYFEHVVKEYFRISGFESDNYTLHTTTSETTIADLTKRTFLPRANESIKQTILLLTGDGGIVDIINVLLAAHLSSAYTKPVIGLFALGTGNALANSTGLNEGHSRGLIPFLRGAPRDLPTFAVRFSPGSDFLVDEARKAVPLDSSNGDVDIVYGAVVCSWALHASLVADSDTTAYRKYGSKRFQMVVKDLLYPSDGSESHRYRGRVTVFSIDAEGKETRHILEEVEHMYILATLVSNLERTFTISAHSKPLDGQLRLLHFGVMSSEEVTRILGLALSGGTHVEEENVRYEDIEGLRIDFEEDDPRWRRICVDGKIVRVGEGGWVEVRRERKAVVDVVAGR